jgi:hypothetical protein
MSLIHVHLMRSQALYIRIDNILDPNIRFTLKRLKYKSYGTSMNFYRNRLVKRFIWLHHKQVGIIPEWTNGNETSVVNTNTTDQVTDLTNSLSINELNLLAKGLKFRLTERLDYKKLIEIRLLYPKQSVFNLPPSDVETDRLLNRIKFKNEEILQWNEFRQSGLNTSRAEYSTLQSLKNKALIYLPSDKGSEFCVLEETRYKELGSYQQITENIIKEMRHQ